MDLEWQCIIITNDKYPISLSFFKRELKTELKITEYMFIHVLLELLSLIAV